MFLKTISFVGAFALWEALQLLDAAFLVAVSAFYPTISPQSKPLHLQRHLALVMVLRSKPT